MAELSENEKVMWDVLKTPPPPPPLKSKDTSPSTIKFKVEMLKNGDFRITQI